MWTTIFRRHQYFNDANFLSMLMFCRRLYFVCAYILSMPLYFVHAIFCRHQYFIDAYVLLTPIFCQCQYFVNAYILSTPIPYQRLYFVEAYFFLTLIFCQRRGFSGRLYLLSLLLIIVLCIYHDYYVLTTSYLSITVSITIKVSYDHTRIV